MPRARGRGCGRGRGRVGGVLLLGQLTVTSGERAQLELSTVLDDENLSRLSTVLDDENHPEENSCQLAPNAECLSMFSSRGIDWACCATGNGHDACGRDKDSDWSCISTLVRSGFLKLLGTSSANSTQWDTGSLFSNQLLCRHTPHQPCGVQFYGGKAFADLLQIFHIEPQQLLDSLWSGSLIRLNPGAGKSGSGFAHTQDNRFVIKLGIKEVEKDSLKILMEGKSLHNHFMKNPDSLLNRYYGMITYHYKAEKQHVVLMGDATYNYAGEIKPLVDTSGGQLTYTTYDLKDREERYAKDPKGLTLENAEFSTDQKNRLYLDATQCDAFSKAIKADAMYLWATHNLVDFSILLTVTTREGTQSLDSFLAGGIFPPCKDAAGTILNAPFCFVANKDKIKYKYTVSIIDYLILYDWKKKAESWVKRGKFTDYGDKLSTFAGKICPARPGAINTGTAEGLTAGHGDR